MAERDAVAAAGNDRISGGGCLRQAGTAHGERPHRALRFFPPLVELQERDGVQPHIAVVGNGQSHGKMVVGRQIVVPFLDAALPRPDIGAAVDGQEPLGISRLPQAAGLVKERCAVGDLMLHDDCPPVSLFSSAAPAAEENALWKYCSIRSGKKIVDNPIILAII